MRFWKRYWALTLKELHQMRRAPKLVFQLTVPPTILLVLWGYALNPEVATPINGRIHLGLSVGL